MKSFTIETSGKGLWSREKRKVKVTDVSIGEGGMHEVRVYFSKKSWDPDEHGLIYTDPLFIKQLRKHLIQNGVPKKVAADLDYTEQGMQGDNYVSLEYGDRTEKFLLSKLFGE